MITPDQTDELTMLARARAGLSPSPADVQRVRESLVAALAAPVTVASDAALSGAEQGAGWSLRVLVTSVAAAAIGAGAAGYWLGHQTGLREARLAAPYSVTSESPPPSLPGIVGAAAVPAGAPAGPAPVPRDATVREAPRRRPGTTARGARPDVSAAATESLGQEVRALRAVERALRDADPRLALAILQQLDRDVPQGKLVEERKAMSVIARCSAGDVPFGVDLGEDFASEHPESVYLGRVEQSCQRRGRGK